jgi:hypothetical protein
VISAAVGLHAKVLVVPVGVITGGVSIACPGNCS